jgi:uncharacterized protein with LGFP repeats
LTSNIGYPITDVAVIDVAGKPCRFNNFKYGGAIYWTAADGAHLIYGIIWLKWVKAGGVQSNIGYPITDEAWAPDHTCRFNNFKYGGAIYWTPADGAHLIYGNIWLKWLSIGGVNSNIGYPITDEESTPGNTARYNLFKNGGAIYWTGSTGACLIYGEIWKKYDSLGGPTSFLGIPITDELSTGSHGGRYNDFSGGSVYWSPATGAHEHQGPLPGQLQFNSNYTFPAGVAAGGDSQITMFRNGNVHFHTHFHDSGAVDYGYSVACAMKDADNQVYTLSHSGIIGGTVSSTPRDDNFDDTRSNGSVADNWRAIVAANPVFQNQAKVNVDLGAVVNEVVDIIKQAGPIVGTIIALF